MLEEIFTKLFKCAPSPTEEEVYAALDYNKWRSSRYIRRLIAETRHSMKIDIGDEGNTVKEMRSSFMMKLFPILRELERQGLAESKECNELTIGEMRDTDDPRLSSPVEIQRIRKERGGRPQVLYRKSKGGKRVFEKPKKIGEIVIGELVTT